MIVCDACGSPFDAVTFIGGVAFCRRCVKKHDAELLSCFTHADYERLVRRLRRIYIERDPDEAARTPPIGVEGALEGTYESTSHVMGIHKVVRERRKKLVM